MRRPLLPVLFVLLAIHLLTPAPAHAVCVVTSICAEYDRAPLIFEGLVESITPTTYHEALFKDVRPGRVAHVRIERTWKGQAPGLVVDLLMRGGATWWVEDEFEFREGERYLVWAYNREGVWRTSACSRTRRLSEAREQFEFLESRLRPATGGFISGRVFVREADGVRPRLPGATVVLEGAGERRETFADGEGRYRFDGLKAGKYEVGVTMGKLAARGDAEIADVRDCQEIDLFVSGRR